MKKLEEEKRIKDDEDKFLEAKIRENLKWWLSHDYLSGQDLPKISLPAAGSCDEKSLPMPDLAGEKPQSF